MKTQFILILLFSFQTFAYFNTQPINLTCVEKSMSVSNYKATITGPNHNGTFNLELRSNYYMATFKDNYILNLVNNGLLQSKKSSISIKQINLTSIVVDIKTDKIASLQLICK